MKTLRAILIIGVIGLIIAGGTTVTLDGGYDCNYTAKTGKMRLKGTMTISNGTIRIEDFIIEE